MSSREESRRIENSRLATTQGPGQNATRKPHSQETATREAGRKVVSTARPPRVKEKGLGVRKKWSGGEKKKGREVKKKSPGVKIIGFGGWKNKLVGGVKEISFPRVNKIGFGG